LVLWFYLTPIFYPLEPVLALPVFRTVYLLNPFVALVELYRLALLGETSLVLLSPAVVLGLAVVAPIGVLLVGLWVFRRHEPTFADWVMG
jgi:ABC-type polysaccharide/polyol phosphate export permease